MAKNKTANYLYLADFIFFSSYWEVDIHKEEQEEIFDIFNHASFFAIAPSVYNIALQMVWDSMLDSWDIIKGSLNWIRIQAAYMYEYSWHTLKWKWELHCYCVCFILVTCKSGQLLHWAQRNTHKLKWASLKLVINKSEKWADIVFPSCSEILLGESIAFVLVSKVRLDGCPQIRFISV